MPEAKLQELALSTWDNESRRSSHLLRIQQVQQNTIPQLRDLQILLPAPECKLFLWLILFSQGYTSCFCREKLSTQPSSTSQPLHITVFCPYFKTLNFKWDNGYEMLRTAHIATLAAKALDWVESSSLYREFLNCWGGHWLTKLYRLQVYNYCFMCPLPKVKSLSVPFSSLCPLPPTPPPFLSGYHHTVVCVYMFVFLNPLTFFFSPTLQKSLPSDSCQSVLYIMLLFLNTPQFHPWCRKSNF